MNKWGSIGRYTLNKLRHFSISSLYFQLQEKVISVKMVGCGEEVSFVWFALTTIPFSLQFETMELQSEKMKLQCEKMEVQCETF